MQFNGISPESVRKLKDAIDGADAILIGAGSGLSTAAGLTGAGDRFRRFFSDFIQKYHFRDMYTAGFYPFPTKEEFWAYWSRYILINRYETPPKPVYPHLLKLVKEKDYFAVTTNVDHCFQKAGFLKEQLFYSQGDYGLFQCSVPCHRRTYDNEEVILRMIAEQKDMRIPSELVPRCPKCGAPMAMNLRSDETFVEDFGWNEAASRYVEFVEKHLGKKLLLLELGVDSNPAIIRYPFWKLTAQNPNTLYVCVNSGETQCPPQIESRSIVVNADLADLIEALQ